MFSFVGCFLSGLSWAEQAVEWMVSFHKHKQIIYQPPSEGCMMVEVLKTLECTCFSITRIILEHFPMILEHYLLLGGNALHSWLCADSRAFIQHCWTFTNLKLFIRNVFLQWYLSRAARTCASFCWSQFCSIFPGKLLSSYNIYIIEHTRDSVIQRMSQELWVLGWIHL